MLPAADAQDPLLVPGRTCWRRAPAARVRFLVDAAEAFAAFAGALERARESVLVAGWDLDHRMRLRPDAPPLSDVFCQALARVPHLRIDLLAWDFSMLYAMERSLWPLVAPVWPTSPRFRFQFDDRHPLGACHHQKIAVIDDSIAFVGGLDLADRRWDTPEHQAHDPRRVDTAGRPYPPFHDVQVMVDGEAAAALGDLLRERWRQAGERPPDPPRDRGDRWPSDLPVDLRGVEVAIARTVPEGERGGAVYEVERLTLDAVAAAERFVYAETQYFTSRVVTDALARRLAERDGPEMLLVLPRRSPSWLEHSTMDALTARELQRLTAADRHGRLAVCYPVVPGLPDPGVFVHAKVLVVDDWLVRVGSSNLDNRSMRVDTECDAAIEATDAETRQGIEAFRNRLLGEHLGCTPETVARAVEGQGSLLDAVEALSTRERGLRPVPLEEPLSFALASAMADPDAPPGLDTVMDSLFRGTEEASGGAGRRRLGLLVVAGIALTATWLLVRRAGGRRRRR